VIRHSRLLADTFAGWSGRPLLAGGGDDRELARALYHAPFALLSHGTQNDPLFNYGNLVAQRLWELGWERLVGLPSRRSAEPEVRVDRARALEEALREGWMEGYVGVRVSRSGRRFRIEDGIIWNLLDSNGRLHGQAATFARWVFL